MPAFTWIAKSATFAGLCGSAGAVAFAKNFAGNFQVNLGTSTYAFLGERQTHIFGNDIKLVSCGKAGGIGSPLAMYLNTPLALPLNILGANGDVSLVYGPRTAITYGGPKTDILRGRQIKKTSYYTPMETRPDNEEAGAAARLAEFSGAQPKEPTGIEAAATDAQTERVIVCMSTLLNDITLALELAVRFKYPTYSPSNTSTSDPAFWLNTVTSVLSDMFIGLIYGIETTSAEQQLGARLASVLAYGTEKVALLLTTIASGAKSAPGAIKGWFERNGDAILNGLKIVGWVILSLICIAVLLGMVALSVLMQAGVV